MQDRALYNDRAELYDAIYHWKDYPEECEALSTLLADEGVPDGARLLEAACGTGKHLALLAERYDVAGFDLAEGMLTHARQRLPNAHLFQADMSDFQVDRPYDALISLFSSIGYLQTAEALASAARCFAAALRPGGVLIVEPWLNPAVFIPGHMSVQTYSSPDLKCTRACIGQLEGDVSVLNFHWLVLRQGAADVEYFTEQHRLRLTPPDALLAIFDDAGFEVRHDRDGLMRDRGLLIGRKR